MPCHPQMGRDGGKGGAKEEYAGTRREMGRLGGESEGERMIERKEVEMRDRSKRRRNKTRWHHIRGNDKGGRDVCGKEKEQKGRFGKRDGAKKEENVLVTLKLK